MTTVLGPIQKIDEKDGSERTAPQVVSIPSFDSRLVRNDYPITHTRIRELRADPTIQLARWCILSQMIHTPWMYLNPKKLATQEMLDFVDENLVPIRDLFLQQAVFGTSDFGWQPFEVVFKPQSGQIFIDNLKALLHEYTTILIYINNGRFAGFVNETWSWSSEYNGSVEVPEPYALNTNFEVEGTDWYGISVYKCLEKISKAWDTIQDAAGRYDKKIAGATWVIYYPVGRTTYNGVKDVDNDKIARMLLHNLESSGGVVIPDDIQDSVDEMLDHEAKGRWRIELISDKGATSSTFIDRQKYLDALKMRAFGFPERAILEGTHGTKEEAGEHGNLAVSNVDSKHRLLCAQLNLYLLPALMRFNFGKKYEWAIRVVPAPLVDKQFSTIKDVYRTILQTPELAEREVSRLNMDAILTELAIPFTPGQSERIEREVEKREKREGEEKKKEQEKKGVPANG